MVDGGFQVTQAPPIGRMRDRPKGIGQFGQLGLGFQILPPFNQKLNGLQLPD
jgi:hypothetical protein